MDCASNFNHSFQLVSQIYKSYKDPKIGLLKKPIPIVKNGRLKFVENRKIADHNLIGKDLDFIQEKFAEIERSFLLAKQDRANFSQIEVKKFAEMNKKLDWIVQLAPMMHPRIKGESTEAAIKFINNVANHIKSEITDEKIQVLSQKLKVLLEDLRSSAQETSSTISKIVARFQQSKHSNSDAARALNDVSEILYELFDEWIESTSSSVDLCDSLKKIDLEKDLISTQSAKEVDQILADFYDEISKISSSIHQFAEQNDNFSSALELYKIKPILEDVDSELTDEEFMSVYKNILTELNEKLSRELARDPLDRSNIVTAHEEIKRALTNFFNEQQTRVKDNNEEIQKNEKSKQNNEKIIEKLSGFGPLQTEGIRRKIAQSNETIEQLQRDNQILRSFSSLLLLKESGALLNQVVDSELGAIAIPERWFTEGLELKSYGDFISLREAFKDYDRVVLALRSIVRNGFEFDVIVRGEVLKVKKSIVVNLKNIEEYIKSLKQY